mmetsp:Transcript_3116/g.7317  ORF Transcript_3116/g.7317 Transcript_3116/m.7317 type:complete len:84 (-) Transcript_3116:156-407(-)
MRETRRTVRRSIATGEESIISGDFFPNNADKFITPRCRLEINKLKMKIIILQICCHCSYIPKFPMLNKIKLDKATIRFQKLTS